MYWSLNLTHHYCLFVIPLLFVLQTGISAQHYSSTQPLRLPAVRAILQIASSGTIPHRLIIYMPLEQVEGIMRRKQLAAVWWVWRKPLKELLMLLGRLGLVETNSSMWVRLHVCTPFKTFYETAFEYIHIYVGRQNNSWQLGAPPGRNCIIGTRAMLKILQIQFISFLLEIRSNSISSDPPTPHHQEHYTPSRPRTHQWNRRKCILSLPKTELLEGYLITRRKNV